MEDLVGAELEALEYTYGAEALTVLQTAPLHLSVSIAPHTGDLATERYVNANLTLETTAAYPDEAPKLQLLHAKGMSDARIEVVMSRLQAEAHSLVGEMMLGSLIETAKDAMTSINQPEGNCIYCLENLVPADWSPAREVEGLLRLPCYHTFHSRCFSRWWQWRQTSMAQQAAELKQDLQSAAPQRLEAEGLTPDAEGVFTVLCPVCRILVTPADLQHMSAHASQPNVQPQLSAPLHSATSLTAKEMQLVKSQQQIRARQFAKQQSQGSIVSNRYGTSIEALAISDMPSAASSSMQAGAAQLGTPHPQHRQASQSLEAQAHGVMQQTGARKDCDHRQARGGGRHRGRHTRGQGRGHHRQDGSIQANMQ